MAKDASAALAAGAFADLVDRFAAAHQQVIQARPFINLHDRLWDNLKKTPQFKDAAANQPLTLQGSLWRIELDARQPERKVTPVAAVFERLKNAVR